MEGWKDGRGRMEEWKGKRGRGRGEGEEWKIGRLEDWKIGRMEGKEWHGIDISIRTQKQHNI